MTGHLPLPRLGIPGPPPCLLPGPPQVWAELTREAAQALPARASSQSAAFQSLTTWGEVFFGCFVPLPLLLCELHEARRCFCHSSGTWHTAGTQQVFVERKMK